MSWVIPYRVILCRTGRSVTEEDYIERDRVVSEMICNGIKPVYIIFEMSQLKSFSVDKNQLSPNLGFMRQPNLDLAVLVGSGMVTQSLAKTIYPDLPVRYVIVDTVGDAVRYLQDIDPSLNFPPIPPTPPTDDPPVSDG